MNDSDTGDLEALLQYLRRVRGFDFTGYKRPSLSRRIAKRMEQVAIEGFEAYIDYLEVHPDEFNELFDTILINVTSFFRDAATWEGVTSTVVPAILAAKDDADAIRVWATACASGEEAYTLAMVLCEALGDDTFKERVKIYATDVDEPALVQARQAAYTDQQLSAVPEELREKYFEPNGNGTAVFRKDLRRVVIFGRHDLVQDAPISRIDLLTCRNTLMYFNAETQARILARFHFALTDAGVLILGKAEALLSRNDDFKAVDLKRRIFGKVPGLPARDRLLGFAEPGDEGAEGMLNDRLGEAAFEAVSFAVLLVDAGGLLAFANHKTRELFTLSAQDLGRPFQDLDVSFRPVELRSAMEQANAERAEVSIRNVQWPAARTQGRETTPTTFDVLVTPLQDSDGAPLGTMIAFTDITVYQQLEEELHAANRELETAYEELQSTNEELETTNEELQSTVEELETTNEELQATNEELETMNEELQSANEELQTMNDELRDRTQERNRVTAFLEAVFSSLRQAVVVVDRDLKVSVWNTHAEELWGLRRGEVEGHNLMSLDFGIPLDEIRPTIRACLDGDDGQPVTVDAVNRRGRAIKCTITCTPLDGASGIRQGAIVTMEDLV